MGAGLKGERGRCLELLEEGYLSVEVVLAPFAKSLKVVEHTMSLKAESQSGNSKVIHHYKVWIILFLFLSFSLPLIKLSLKSIVPSFHIRFYTCVLSIASNTSTNLGNVVNVPLSHSETTTTTC